jgi:hypothetical protein
MWLDYKGQRHFLPTGMPEEPYFMTYLCQYWQLLLLLFYLLIKMKIQQMIFWIIASAN